MPNKQEVFDRIMNDSRMSGDEQAAQLIKEFGEEGALEMIDLNAAEARQKQAEYNAQADYYEEKARRSESRGEDS